ncbi:MAG: Fic family protein [bacterium]|nr:Fic family protein [bacterium]
MHIVKRKKGQQEYFYLQISQRKKGKVINKEVYLGKTMPKNIEKIKESLEQEQKKELYQKLEQIKENFQSEWKKFPKSIQEKELEQIAVTFTYNTNAIEGSTITLEETREIIEEQIAPHKSLKDIKETEAHAKVFLTMLKKKKTITNEIILEWHKKIFGETKEDIAGKYRDYLVRVGSYRAPDWQEIKVLMNELIKNISQKKGNPVEHAARVHYQFEKIHPFGDGNGRIGRLLINHILWHNSYPMLIIEYKKRKSYYKALTKDEESFVKYFLRRYLTVHKKRSIS